MQIAVAISACLLALASCSSSSSATSKPPASPPGQSCAWPSVIGVQTSNRVVPDSAASYWDQPIAAGASARITISGTYPDARYFSLSVYTPYATPFTANGVSSSLPDYRIAPEHGSTNPWQYRASPGGRFQVTIRSDVTPGQSDVLPFPAGTSTLHPGYLVYRLYLPAGGNFSHVKLPTVTLTQGSTRRTLPACRTHGPVPTPEKAPGGTAPASGGTVPAPPGAFYKPAVTRYVGLLANADTAYTEAYIIRPPAADVVVVTAKAPTYEPGSPSPWPAAGKDMRYWSMCIGVGISTLPTVVNKLPAGHTDYGCRADEATKLDAAGDYTYVIGSEAQRAAISRVPGVTFLPFSSTQATRVYLLLLRNLLVNPSFTHSVQNITQAKDAPAASAAMGPYYPRVSTCALPTLTRSGVSACEPR